MAVNYKLIKKRCVAKQARPTINSQCVTSAGNKVQKADVAVLKNIVKAVGAAVSRSFGDRNRSTVQHKCKAGRVSFRRQVA